MNTTYGVLNNSSLIVDTDKLRENVRTILRSLPAGTKLIPVVKDDAYGHGALKTAHALSDMVCAFAVSTVDEGAQLVHGGGQKDILVLTPPLTAEEAKRAKALGLILTLSSVPALRLATRAGRGVRARLAVNTGMNRYGFPPDEGGVPRGKTRGRLCGGGVLPPLRALPCGGAARAGVRLRRGVRTGEAGIPAAFLPPFRDGRGRIRRKELRRRARRACALRVCA